MNKNQLQTIVYGISVILLMGLYVAMIFAAAFPYNAEEHRRAEIAKERAEQRVKAFKNLQEEYMREHH